MNKTKQLLELTPSAIQRVRQLLKIRAEKSVQSPPAFPSDSSHSLQKSNISNNTSITLEGSDKSDESYVSKISNISQVSNKAPDLQNRSNKSLSSSIGIRIGVKSGGCSGLSYVFEYADEIRPTDEIVEYEDIKILVDFKALIYLTGTKLDYIDENVRSGFVFINPNSKGECGCGESFHV